MTEKLHVITYQGLAGRAVTSEPVVTGSYLKAFDVEAHEGRGLAEWTLDPSHALLFDGYAEAWDYWRQTSKTHPRRGDGKPNRPLTAFTVLMRPLTEEEAAIAIARAEAAKNGGPQA